MEDKDENTLGEESVEEIENENEVNEVNEEKLSEKDKKNKRRIEKRLNKLSKLEKARVPIERFVLILGFIFLGLSTFIYIGSHNTGIGWDEVLDRGVELAEDGEAVVDRDTKGIKDVTSIPGHIGGSELLIEDEYEGTVSKEEFNKVKENKGDFIVYFYSKYCVYCYNQGDMIVDYLKNTGKNFMVVEANQDELFQKNENIEGLPMVAMYENGEQVRADIGFGSEKDLERLIKGEEND